MAGVWFGLVVFFLGMYVLLDGYDLGIGILLLLDRGESQRRELIDIVATAWDGNESWLILAGVGLWGGFPTAYGVALPALFLPFIVMLFAIILRGAAIELVSSSPGDARVWPYVFGISSLVAAFAQGVVLGGVLSGVRANQGVYVGRSFDFFTPYSVLTGLAAVLLYLVAGTAVVQLKADGELRRRAGSTGRVALGFMVVFAVVLALSLAATATPLHLSWAGRAWPFTVLVVAAGVFAFIANHSFGKTPDDRPLAAVVGVQLCGLAALVVAIYPTIVAPAITVNSAKSPAGTLNFLLIGVGASIPFVLFYNWYAHHVFRGKWRPPATTPEPAGLSRSSQALTPSPTAVRR